MTGEGEDRAVRLPLQTGAGALRDLLAAGALGVLLLTLTAATMGGALYGGVLRAEFGLAVGLWVAGTALGTQGIRALVGGISSARTHRASDLVVRADGIRIVGGRRHGLSATWTRIEPSRCSIEPAITGQSLAFVGGAKYRQVLFLALDGHPVAVAESADAAEDEALEGAFATIRAGCGAGEQPAHTSGPPRCVICAGCGAPAAIDDVPSMPCPFCSTPVTIPDDVRQRLRAARDQSALGAQIERAVEQVLDQPGADRTNLLILLAGIAAGLMACALVVATVLVIGFGARVSPWASLAGAGFGATTGLVLLAYAHVADRRGLRTLVLGFTARSTPTGAQCRRCAAPLPARQPAPRRRSSVARCVYCDAENVLAPGAAHTSALRSADAELRDLVGRLRTTKTLLGLGAVASFTVAAAGFGAFWAA